jgi:hypothetical protein
MKKIVFILILIAGILVSLVVTNPDERDFREWYVEEYGFGGALVSLAVQRENRIFFSTYSIGGQAIIKKHTLAYGIAGIFIKGGD